MYNIIELPSLNYSCGGIAISVTYSECVYVALVMQHATRMRRIILSSAASPYFSTLSKKRYNFKKMNTKCVFLQILTERPLILKKIQRNITINLRMSLGKVSVILVGLRV
jgi:hypothetical protein